MRAARTIAALLGFGFVPVAAVMIFAPGLWYERFPGVLETGPLNHHFVRDLGCAFLVAGVAFLYAAIRPSRARGLVLASAALLTLHAAMHVAEAAFGGHGGWRIVDLATIYLPAALACASAALWRGPPSS